MGPDHRGVRGIGGQHRGRRGRPGRPGRLSGPGRRRPPRPRLHPRHPLDRRGLRPARRLRPVRAIAGHRPLPGAGDRGRRADHGHPPRGGLRLRLGRPARRSSRLGPGRLPRGLPVGAALGQGGHAGGHRGGPRQRRRRGPHRLRPVLRRAPPARVPRPVDRRPRAPLRQRGGGDDAVRLHATFDAAVEAVEETGVLAVRDPGGGRLRGGDGAGPVAVPAAPVDRVVDTTGAGDLFAAGFLYGITNGLGPRGRGPARRGVRGRGHLPRGGPPPGRSAGPGRGGRAASAEPVGSGLPPVGLRTAVLGRDRKAKGRSPIRTRTEATARPRGAERVVEVGRIVEDGLVQLARPLVGDLDGALGPLVGRR